VLNLELLPPTLLRTLAGSEKRKQDFRAIPVTLMPRLHMQV